MSAVEALPIDSCRELSPGDEVQATYKGTLVHRGRVTDLAPDHNLLWIIDDLRGGRRLLDLAELEVSRIKAKPTGPSQDAAA